MREQNYKDSQSFDFYAFSSILNYILTRTIEQTFSFWVCSANHWKSANFILIKMAKSKRKAKLDEVRQLWLPVILIFQLTLFLSFNKCTKTCMVFSPSRSGIFWLSGTFAYNSCLHNIFLCIIKMRKARKQLNSM